MKAITPFSKAMPKQEGGSQLEQVWSYIRTMTQITAPTTVEKNHLATQGHLMMLPTLSLWGHYLMHRLDAVGMTLT